MTRQTHICIIARDISGFMAGAYLRRRFPDFRISLLDLREAGEVVEAELFSVAHPDLRRFNRFLRVQESDFIRATDAAFYLGDQISGFSETDYVLPYGDWGTDVNGIDLFDLTIAQGGFTSLRDLADYSFPATLIKHEKFLPPDAKGRPILSDFDYGYQFNPSAYADFLLRVTPGMNLLSKSEATCTGEKVMLKGEPLDVDLYIDASAAADYEDIWSDYGFPAGYSTTVQPRSANHTQPLQINIENSKTPNVAVTTQRQIFNLSYDGKNDRSCGRKVDAWNKNILRLGLSQARLFPLCGSPLRSIILDIERLADLMPSGFRLGDDTPIEAHEYNRLTSEAYDRLRDLTVLLFSTAGRAKIQPDSVTTKLDLFQSRGRVQILDQDQLVKDHVKLILLGQGVIPKRVDPLAALVPAETIETTIAPIRQLIGKVIPTMPSHSAFIARNCAIDGYRPTKAGAAA